MKTIKKTSKKFHLTWVTIEGGGEAKMESGHTFLRFFLEPFPNWTSELQCCVVCHRTLQCSVGKRCTFLKYPFTCIIALSVGRQITIPHSPASLCCDTLHWDRLNVLVRKKKVSCIRATLGPLVRVWFRSTDTIPWVWVNTMGVVNTMSQCLYHESMFIP